MNFIGLVHKSWNIFSHFFTLFIRINVNLGSWELQSEWKSRFWSATLRNRIKNGCNQNPFWYATVLIRINALQIRIETVAIRIEEVAIRIILIRSDADQNECVANQNRCGCNQNPFWLSTLLIRINALHIRIDMVSIRIHSDLQRCGSESILIATHSVCPYLNCVK